MAAHCGMDLRSLDPIAIIWGAKIKFWGQHLELFTPIVTVTALV